MLLQFQIIPNGCKSAFLNAFIDQVVFDEQPPGFENKNFSNHIFKLSKVLYGLKQPPSSWYERLSGFLIDNEFKRGVIDDIIFGATNESLCKVLSCLMQKEFEMNMMGELQFFLGLQVHQTKE
ncbi:hypothetical protein ACH5RR_008662 [Cinchona calisaya]|uniref:Reverse transcriptase Ty1/copia-type domain-containing protein n=1 Tax=Cinchona calisaya TaxID=153742 RepID=A0ABD3ABZ9_9GENT